MIVDSPLFRQLLLSLDAELAHSLTIRVLRLVPRTYSHRRIAQLHAKQVQAHSVKPKTYCGLQFPNPVGLAAGFDKNAECVDALASLGFGFIEVGTIVPRPQAGNPRPRVFRLPEAQAVINRYGFNSKGVDYAAQQLKKRSRRIIVGINIGKNRDTPVAEASCDYITCMRKLYVYADYFAINISSPNTPGLRELESNPVLLHKLLEEIKQAHTQLQMQHGHRVPLLIKLSPDEDLLYLTQLTKSLITYEIDGVIIGNTTLSRPPAVQGLAHAQEAGGLSGPPLTTLSNRAIAHVHQVAGDRLPIMGVGGISSGADAKAKLEAGAQLLQLYTGLIYQGPGLIQSILQEI